MRSAKIFLILGLGCFWPLNAQEPTMNPSSHTTDIATFGGGCFWCMESPYDRLPGVIRVIPGYTGGHTKNPTYEQVCTGTTGHAEAVQITFDPKKISYETLLDVFWHNIDPTTKNQQFADFGTQYRTVVFYHSDEQRRLAESTKKRWDKSGIFGAPIVTEITPASAFYPAEDYHVCYYKKNPGHYERYRRGSGRAGYLEMLWGTKEK